jgi:hypothetical protein
MGLQGRGAPHCAEADASRVLASNLKAQIDAHRDLSTSLDLDREPAALAV